LLHQIPTEQLGPLGEPMAHAVQTCVHCGFCLPACPTYLELGNEMDSPRGRIFLMKEVLEGKCDLDQALPYIDKCLGCLGCVTACPSGVPYDQLITPFRAYAENKRHRTLFDRLLRFFVLSTLPYPERFRWGVWSGRFAKPFKHLLPRRLRSMLELLPSSIPSAPALPEIYSAEGTRRARVALLAGCAQRVLAPEINWATLRVLAKNGVEVVIPRQQGCCGALAAHTGAGEKAKSFARQNLKAFPKDIDAIVTNAAGCGSGMHEYPLWLKGDPQEEEARELAHRSKDISVFLEEIGIVDPPPSPVAHVLAYHDACHLVHAQKVRNQPRSLLSKIGNLRIVDVPDGEICCGSAGTYNIEQPDIAAALGKKKAESIVASGASLVASGNIGCLTQIRTHLTQLGRPLPTYHTMEILDFAYRQQWP
jgi:glycolate oxidase iron-sulfur subunit